MSNFYIGLMSGTSLDGIDAVMMDFSDNHAEVIETYFEPYSAVFRQKLLNLTFPGENEIERLGQMDRMLGKLFAETILKLLAKTSIAKSAIQAIGSHGQTIRHQIKGGYPYTLQIGDPNTIKSITGIVTVADFRRADVAEGGQGAPLVPAFHQAIFGDPNEVRIVLNIGGIANISVLAPHQKTVGFDTGPGNRLLDDWAQVCLGKHYDDEGDFAKSGKVDKNFVDHLLVEPYFSLPFPKSTGRELFDLNWLEKKIHSFSKPLTPETIQASLLQFTVDSIALAIQQLNITPNKIIVCGGGANNTYLMSQLRKKLNFSEVMSSEAFNIKPCWVEAAAFAWLAKQTLEGKPGNLPSVTGAQKSTILGGVWR